MSKKLNGRKDADISRSTLFRFRKYATTEDTEITLSWFRMSILFRWNPLTVCLGECIVVCFEAGPW